LPAPSAGETAAWIPRYDGPCGSSASRRALLPRSLWPDVAADVGRRAPSAAPQTGRPQPPTRLLYRPEWFCHSPAPAAPPMVTGNRFEPYSFDTLFRERRNPWHYETEYEQTKYAQTLELLPRPSFPRALELACAEGHFTTLLAPRCTELCAADISPTALRRAARRCRGQTNIRLLELDLLRAELPGQFDLIVSSEVLYYTGTIENLRRVVAKITRALRPGGWLATAHAHLVVDEPHRSGFDWDLPFGAKRISAVIQAQPGLSLRRDLRTPLYRVQLYRREPRWRPQLKRREAKRILLPQPTELPPDVAPHALWRGGYPRAIRPEVAVTRRLPILMYHRIAPRSGIPARYCVSPEAFDAQLRALATRGFRCVSLDEWRRAMIARRPLAGRCVVLTFDDGYRDFLDHAWPLLQRYGFTATIFLPTDFVGSESRWDARLGETFPLLGWDEVQRLHAEGIAFGSHSSSHVALAGQPPA
jgi:SAM-dependent methyltransferase